MVKDGEDSHGVIVTNFKNHFDKLEKLRPYLSSCERHDAALLNLHFCFAMNIFLQAVPPRCVK